MAQAVSMSRPPEPIETALIAAATQTRVPYTLLAAVAFQESSYKPAAVGVVTAGGWQAKGLMQLAPSVLEQYQLRTDPEIFDASLNAMAGARHLARLFSQLSGEWQDTLAAYCWGLANVRRYRSLRRRYPVAVRGYIDAVLSNRAWLQDQVLPSGSTAFERIKNAIEGLAKLNPTVTPIVELAQLFKGFWESYAGKVIEDIALLDVAPLTGYWREYARLYDLAPLTGPGTPPPRAIEPSLWMELLRRAGSDQLYLPSGEPTVRQPTAIVRRAPDMIVLPPSDDAAGEGLGITGGGYLLLGALLLLAFRKW